MDATTAQRMREHIKASEGVREQAYKDTKGKLTVGIGFLVDDETSFTAIPFQVTDPVTGQTRPATFEEKQTEFRRLKSSADTSVRSAMTMPRAAMEQRLDAEIAARIDRIRNEIGAAAWNALTDGQKIAVLDIHYANGGLSRFPRLKAAIRNGDAREMANQSDFHGGPIAGTRHHHRNFDRLRRDKAAMLGIDCESDEAYRQVANAYPDHPRLPERYKSYRA